MYVVLTLCTHPVSAQLGRAVFDSCGDDCEIVASVLWLSRSNLCEFLNGEAGSTSQLLLYCKRCDDFAMRTHC